jgi:CheY-like chemotaxis protein
MSQSVLVVDDDRAGRFALGEVLEDLASLVMVGSGEEALREVLRREFSAIVLDVRLPGMDGFEVAAAIRSLARTRQTPIIFISAHTDRRTEPRLAGIAERYLQKPLVPELIRRAVAEALETPERLSPAE